MTTTTREQALTPAELRELCAQLSEDGQAMLHRAVHASHMSGLELGREQGLRELGAMFDQPHMEYFGDQIAAAIEQLRK